MAFTEAALQDRGHEVDGAESNDVKPEDLCRAGNQGKGRGVIAAHVVVAAEHCQAKSQCDQQAQGDDDGPYRHVQAKDGAADVFMAGPGIDVEQALPFRHHQQQDGESQGDAGVAVGVWPAQVEQQTEADSEHGDTLQETERAGEFAERILHDGGRREDGGDDSDHAKEIEVVQERQSALDGRRGRHSRIQGMPKPYSGL